MMPHAAAAALVVSAAPPRWRAEFAAPDSSLFTHMQGLRHCDDVCFEADDAMLQYAADLGGGRRGLKVTTTDAVCANCSAADAGPCYYRVNATCAPFVSQYLMSADPVTGKGNYYQYGDYEVSMRAGHRANGSAAGGTFSCFTPGTTPAHGDDDPLHNELALCFDGGNPTQAKFLYWFNQTIQKTIFDLGFDASAALHTYSVWWRPDRIAWGVDGKVVHTDTGIARQTIPWQPTVMVVGLLKPHGAAASGTSELHVEYVAYTPAGAPRALAP